MLSWVVLNFILVIYSNATQLTSSLIAPLARTIWIRPVRPSIQKYSWNWLFSFFLELHMVLGFMWCCVWQSQIFRKNCFTPKMGKKGQAQGSLNVQESSVFFSVLYFFISLVYNESLYYCNSCMLEQISYFGKFWFLRYGPRMLLANQIAGFFNQSQDSRIGCISQRN